MIESIRRTVRFWGLLFLLCGAGVAQSAGYTASITTAYPQLAINNAVARQVVWAAGNSTGFPSATIACDDCISQVMPIGFNFNFGGVNYPNWSMQSNGVIFFQAAGATGAGTTGSAAAQGGPTYSPNNLPTANFGTAGQPALMPFWADLIHNASSLTFPQTSARASLYQYQVLTVSGAQVLVIQLTNVGYFSAPANPVNMQIQIWSTGQIVYAYGSITTITSGNNGLTIGLQYPGGGCNSLANKLSTSLSNQSYLFAWDANAPACQQIPTVNHFEIRESGTATMCAEPVKVLACSSATAPCPAANIISNQIINAAVTVTGTGSVGTPNISPSSFNLQPGSPIQTVNLTWATGSAGTATLGVQASIATTGALVCTNAAGTARQANCNMVVSNRACVTPPHHFEIRGPATGSTCANSTFTIRAWADAAQAVPYTAGWTGTLTQTGNPASIPNLGAFTVPAGSSSVDISPVGFVSAGTTTFSTSSPTPLVGSTTCNFGGSTSCALVASKATCAEDFNCTESVSNTSQNPADSASTAGRLYSKLAGTGFSFDVMARLSTGAVATGYASDADKTVNVELVDGSTGGSCAAYPNITGASPTSQNLVFAKTNQATDLGRKSVSFTVGNSYQNVRCRARDNNGVVGCSQDSFAIRPQGVTLSATGATATAPSASASPAIAAGSSFSLRAVASPNTATNYAGTLNQVTAKITAQDPTQNVAASGGTPGALSPNTLTAGQTVTNATYSEVGYAYLEADAYVDSNYAAIDSPNDCVAGSSSNVLNAAGKYGCNVANQTTFTIGRFRPNNFITVVTPACVAGNFSYAGSTTPARTGQAFSVVVTAQNAAGGATANYRGLFAHTPTLTNAGSTVGLSGNALTFSNGVATASVVYTADTPQSPPVTLVMRAVDSDPVSPASSVGFAQGQALIRSGQVRLANAYGSELLDLPMLLTAQYWNGTGWATNTLDSCTTGVSLNAVIVSGALTVSKVCAWDSGAPGLSGMGCSAAGVSSKKFASPASAGNFNLNLQKPGAGFAGTADITVTVPTWLQSVGNGSVVSSPKGRATFGVYKSPLIYLRENY